MSVDPVTGQEFPDTGYYESGAYVVINYLKTRVTEDIIVESQIPNPRPPRLIVVHGVTTSGQMNIALAWRRNLIHIYDATESLSVRLAEMVRGYHMDGKYKRGSGFRDVRVIGEPYYFPDPDDPAKTPRAQTTIDVLLRARFNAYGPQTP